MRHILRRIDDAATEKGEFATFRLVYGGSASGKSAFAEELVIRSGNMRRIYIATMEIYDEESVRRVERHRGMRAQKGFSTVESPRDLEAAARLVPSGAVVLLECFGNLAANELFAPEGERTAEEGAARILGGLGVLLARAEEVVAVTNDIFCDGENYPEGTARYIECLATVNREAARLADEVYEVVCGLPIKIKGGGEK